MDEVSEIVGVDKMDIVEKPIEETTKSVNSLIEEAVINVEEPVVDAPKAAAEPVAEVPTTKVNSIPMELSRSESTKSDHQDSSELEGGEIVNDEENINPDLKLKYDYKEDQ